MSLKFYKEMELSRTYLFSSKNDINNDLLCVDLVFVLPMRRICDRPAHNREENRIEELLQHLTNTPIMEINLCLHL